MQQSQRKQIETFVIRSSEGISKTRHALPKQFRSTKGLQNVSLKMQTSRIQHLFETRFLETEMIKNYII